MIYNIKLFFCLEKEMEMLTLLMKSINEAESTQPYLSSKKWLAWELNIQEDILVENERWNLTNVY